MAIQWFEVKIKLGVDNDIDGDREVPMTNFDVHEMMYDNRTYQDDRIVNVIVESVVETELK